jgi:alpha-tubulin suppressor-like RCC1 family protein
MARGKVVCWGANNSGKLGNGTTGDAKMDAGFEPLPGGALAPPAIGVAHGCIVTTDKNVYCAGQDVVEQLGNGPGEVPSLVPAQTLVMQDVGLVDAGATHTVALSGAGAIFCWGDNTSKQCAANGTYVSTPTSLGFPGVWKTVSAGVAHTCAIDSLNRVFCWGDNSASQTAQSGGPTTTLPAQVQVAGMQPLLATQVSAGGKHTCAVSQGEVFCWGNNDMQQICHGMATAESPIPNACPIQAPVSQVGASVNGACALDQDDGVHCWGHASLVDAQAVGWYGVPTPVYDNAQQISVGTDHACALLHGGEVVCWGRNDNGQVNGTSMPSEILPPTQVFGP